jgi:hypothetical protein
MLLAADKKAVMLDKVNATDCRFFLAWAVVGVEPTLPLLKRYDKCFGGTRNRDF